MKAEAAERELEKAVFGDEAGFRENLNRFQEDARDARHYSAEAASSGSEADFEALADADVSPLPPRPRVGTEQ